MAETARKTHTIGDKLLGTFQTIRMRVLALVIISVLTPSLLGGLLAIRHLDSILKEQVYQILSRNAERHALHLSQWFANRVSDVRAFTSSYLLNEDVSALLSGAKGQARVRYLASIDRYLTYLLEDNASFTGFAIVTGDGARLAAQPEDILSDIVSDDFLENLGTDPKILELPNGRLPRIIVGQALPGQPEEGRVFFIGSLNPEPIQYSLYNDLPNHSTAYIINERGTIRGITDPELFEKQIPQNTTGFLSTDGRTLEYMGLTGEKVVGTSFAIELLPWRLILETPRKMAFLPLTYFRGQLTLMTVILSAILLIPALLLARTIIIPLEELSRVARSIRSGKPGTQVSINPRGELGEFVATFNRMSSSLKMSMEEVQAINNQLRVMSITDPLTGRYNRRFINDHIRRELKLAQRTGQPVSVLMIDLDNFKEYNDRHGHIAGDEALRKLGDVLVDQVRETDVVARYGGEEFLVYLSHTNTEGARQVAEKLREAVEQTSFSLKGEDTRITISVGVATAHEEVSTYEDLVDHADKAMYRAKAEGRNLVQAFSGPDLS
jgi:diguanylate cyclase (GGDEF)-like protein